MAEKKVATDYVCLALSPNGFICNREPKHDGDHVAYAGTERYEADRWENDKEPTIRRQRRSSEEKA